MIVKGMIEECKSISGKKDGKTWEKINVVIQGVEYGGFLPKWAKLRGTEGKYCELDYSENGKYRNVEEIHFIPLPEGADLTKGLDAPRMTEKDVQIAKLNCNTCTAMLVSQMARFGFFTEKDQIYPEWEKAYRFNLKMVGIEDQP
jgi:hypothetical protein